MFLDFRSIGSTMDTAMGKQDHNGFTVPYVMFNNNNITYKCTRVHSKQAEWRTTLYATRAIAAHTTMPTKLPFLHTKHPRD